MPDHKGAASLLEKIRYREEVLSRPLPPAKRPDVVEKKQTIAQRMSEGKQYFGIKDYNRAETLFEKVLLEDEYNVDAMRYLKKIGDVRLTIRTKERDAAAAEMMQEVRKAWNAPIRKEVQLPETVTGGAVVQTKTATQRLQDKMANIMIPSIEFRQANITDVVNFLVEESIRQDMAGAGVNIILNMSIPGQEGSSVSASAAPSGESTNPFEEAPSGEGALGAVPASLGVKTITLNLRRISLLDAIKYITEVASLKFRVEDNAVIITPAGVVSGHVITRMYPVQPSILDVVIQREETKEKTGEFVEMGSKTTIKRGDVKDFFEKSGVPFPVGTSITYNPTISQLIVANTPENLDTFERILAQLNVIPSQIEIEARFVEVGENDLEEMGFQWMLTDNWEIAENTASGPVGGRERVQINADENGFTKGLRFFGFDSSSASIDPVSAVTRNINTSPLGGILTAASVLTNPQLKVILQALSQHGNADLLSAPRVTTKNGVNAQIQIVKEIIYPTEFEVTQPTVQSQGDLVTPPTVTPGSFETREVGVILNVTPAVGPDGYTIDLTMVPEVAELVDWIQYGSSITVQSQDFVFNIPQPVFSSRNATTSIVIWDGQTVVLGGLIREELVTIRDKIPFLGDIPIIGRLFRSEGQQSKKTNLLIFVTARLVDPAGNPIHKTGGMAMPGGGSQAQAGAVTK
jgi:general secretion pathway protein D